MASSAQMERELIVKITKAGLESVKKLERVGGRKRTITDSKLTSGKKFLESGVLGIFSRVNYILGLKLKSNCDRISPIRIILTRNI